MSSNGACIWEQKRSRSAEAGISQVAALSGADWKTVQRGVKELTGERTRAQGRIRQAGGGRKKAVVRDPTLQADLEALLEPKG